MADDDDLVDDEDYGDDEGLGAEGEGTEGQDPGDGDEDLEASAERADASTEEDQRPQDLAETERPLDREPQRPQGRAAARVQRLLRERAEDKRRLQALEDERQANLRQQWQNRQAETEQQRQARLAIMTPEERTAEEWREWQQGINQTVQRSRFEFAAEMDRAKFEAKAINHPLYQKWQNKVEEVFQDRLRQGLPMANREVIMDYLIGKQARETASSSTRKARVEGRKRVEAATTRPGSSKGDAGTTRGKRGETAEDRLRGVEI